jgi:hypothetical protein
MFGHDFKMNMQGETAINSHYGAFVSVGCLSVLLAFAVIRFIIFHEKRDTLNASIIEQDYLDESYVFDFDQSHFNLAFTVEGYDDRIPRDDPEYVEFLVQMYSNVHGVVTATKIDFHTCSQNDLNSFYAPNKKMKR